MAGRGDSGEWEEQIMVKELGERSSGVDRFRWRSRERCRESAEEKAHEHVVSWRSRGCEADPGRPDNFRYRAGGDHEGR